METKRDRREEAREKARLAREQAKKKRKRNRLFLQGGIGVVVLAVAAIIAVVVVSGTNTGPVVSPKNMATGGIILKGNAAKDNLIAVRTAAVKKQTNSAAYTGSGPAKIVEYVDPQCPFCKQFEQTNSEQIAGYVANGLATLEIHPITLPSLEAASNGNHYSSRAVNALDCVANYEPDKFYTALTALYANQPEEGGHGMTNAQLNSTMGNTGSDQKMTDCINNNTYKKWVASTSTKALTEQLPNSGGKKLTGTPTVFVNGKQFTGNVTDADAFKAFVMKNADSTGTAISTPTATSTATTPAG